MSGTKTIINNSGVTISVVLRGRNGAEPNSGNLPPVSATIGPHGSATLQYGNDQHPYLNSLQVEENSNGSDTSATFACLTRGGLGTLDNLFNSNSKVTVSYNPSSYSFGLSASN
jgi:hypothetical protein